LKLIQQLKKDHIVEVKAINTPTATVKLIVTGVMILLGQKPDLINIPGSYGKKEEDYFGKAKKIYFSKPNDFLKLMLDFAENQRENINPAYIKKLAVKVVHDDNFNEKDAGNACLAIKFIYFWV